MLKNSNKSKCVAILFPAVLTAALLLYFLLTQQATMLVVESRDTGASRELELPEDAFTLGFTHSVMKTQVEERYRVDKDRGLVMVETVYQSYGAGLPFLPEDGRLTMEDGLFRLEMDREVGVLHMTVSSIPDHWLQIGDQRYPLASLCQDSASIAVYTRTTRRLRPGLNAAGK